MINIIEKFVNTLKGIEYWVTVPLFVLMLVLMIAQVICRYILEIPLSFSEELCRYIFVACTFLGAAIATAERGQIEINFTELTIERLFKTQSAQIKAGIFMNVVRDLGTIICLAIVAFETYFLVADQFRMKQVSTAMEMPFWVVTGSMFLGLVLCILHSAGLIVLNLSGRGPMGYEFAEGESKRCIS